MAVIPARLPDTDWWTEHATLYLRDHLQRPTPETLRSLWDFCEQYRQVVERGAVKPLQIMAPRPA